MRQTKARASAILFFSFVGFLFGRKVKPANYLGRELNHEPCLNHNFFLAMTLFIALGSFKHYEACVFFFSVC